MFSYGFVEDNPTVLRKLVKKGTTNLQYHVFSSPQYSFGFSKMHLQPAKIVFILLI